ncbi:MAG TPA: MFS transporter, partial [Burkholderiaceae bacterium]|nr:MFS transporter [Burkholderiaceae bacterium]
MQAASYKPPFYSGHQHVNTTPNTTHSAASKLGNIIRVTSGNFLEMFDFFLFGLYATNISKTFFPSHDEFASLMATFATFGAG